MSESTKELHESKERKPESDSTEIWVDDCKPAPEGCAVARTYDDALRMMRRFQYSKLYLDHDLGEKRTGYDLLLELIAENRVPLIVECISWNPVGRKRIAAALESMSRVALPRGAEPENLLSPRGDDGTAKAEATSVRGVDREGSTARTETQASTQIAP